MVSLLVWICCLGPALGAPPEPAPAAEAPPVRGEITGNVVDEPGEAMAAVLVTLSSPVLIGGSRQTTTDALGNFRFDALAPSSYAILAEMPGFCPVTRTGVEVQIGRTTPVVVALRAGSSASARQADPVTIDTSGSYPEGRSDYPSEWPDLRRVPTGRSYPDAVSAVAAIIASPASSDDAGLTPCR